MLTFLLCVVPTRAPLGGWSSLKPHIKLGPGNTMTRAAPGVLSPHSSSPNSSWIPFLPCFNPSLISKALRMGSVVFLRLPGLTLHPSPASLPSRFPPTRPQTCSPARGESQALLCRGALAHARPSAWSFPPLRLATPMQPLSLSLSVTYSEQPSLMSPCPTRRSTQMTCTYHS